MEDRRDALQRLSRKHGTTPDGLADLANDMGAELTTLRSFEDSLDSLKSEVKTLEKEATAVARTLSRTRQKAAIKLGKAVSAELGDLSFEKARFKVEQTADEKFLGATGMDRIDFTVELNPGEGAHPLKKVASGGELSRMMLAVKRALAGVGPVGTYVFDEVDAGIGGNVANAVAAKLKDVAEHHQLICITHLPQIAAYADAHFHINKSRKNNRTVTAVLRLEKQSRLEEISRMLGGSAQNKQIMAAAKELVKASQQPAQAR